MKVLFTFFLSFGFMALAQAQSLGLQQLGAIGGDIQAGMGPQMTHSMGATAYTIAAQNQVRLDQGMFVPCDLKCSSIADGIETDIYQNPVIDFYPNPTEDMLFLEGASSQIISYKLYSTTGQLLTQGLIEQQQLSLSALPSGIYFLHLFGKQGQLSFVGKVVKQ